MLFTNKHITQVKHILLRVHKSCESIRWIYHANGINNWQILQVLCEFKVILKE